MALTKIAFFLPERVNSGAFVTACTLPELESRIDGARVVLPICSIGTDPGKLAALGPLVLPPLYHEALTPELKDLIVARIRTCFPYYDGSRKRANWRGQLDIVELPLEAPPALPKPRILGFSVDTAVEEHGPHLPLATDTIQSYAVLKRLAEEVDGFVVGPPADYGHLTWGLAFGMSIDLTPPLTCRYVTGYANALMDWLEPEALYVVDTHGSLVHRQAVQEGLNGSRCRRRAFRWVFEPMGGLASERGDFHAGGIETALMKHLNSALLDGRWWPARIDEIAASEMPVKTAVELASNLPAFIRHVEDRKLNGVVGDIRHFAELDGAELAERSMAVAREDVAGLG